jgi:hypothetical protein
MCFMKELYCKRDCVHAVVLSVCARACLRERCFLLIDDVLESIELIEKCYEFVDEKCVIVLITCFIV